MVRIAAHGSPKRIAKGARQGFTLLEVLLASAIGVLLMAALYVAMEVQLRHAQAGRDLVEQSLLVRALLARMANDIRPSLGPALPPPSASGQQAGGAAATTGGAAATTGATSPAAGTGSTTTPAATTSSTNTPSIVLGVQGDSSQLMLWVSRVPLDLNLAATSQSGQPISSDLRRITYWLAGNSSLGLARQEVKLATSDDALVTMPPDIPDEASLVIAEEVQSLQFRYFDGTSWQDSWDATATDSTGAPLGPPLAIEITLGVAFGGSGGAAPDATPNLKTYRHVVAIPTANGTTPPPTTNSSP